MLLLAKYPTNRYGLKDFIKSIDSKSIRKYIFDEYKQELENTANSFAIQIENFNVEYYLETLTLVDIYLVLGLKLKDFLELLSIYSPNIIIEYGVDDNKNFAVYDITN